jgi:hypothetical protein
MGLILLPVCVGFLVDKVAIGQVYLSVLEFSVVSIIAPMHHIHIAFIYHECYIILAVDNVDN